MPPALLLLNLRTVAGVGGFILPGRQRMNSNTSFWKRWVQYHVLQEAWLIYLFAEDFRSGFWRFARGLFAILSLEFGEALATWRPGRRKVRGLAETAGGRFKRLMGVAESGGIWEVFGN